MGPSIFLGDPLLHRRLRRDLLTVPGFSRYITDGMRLLLILVLAPVLLQAEVRFNRDIRPILSEKCFACHGPDSNARQANLRLDRREDAVARGVLTKEKLVARVNHSNKALRMPPVYSNKTLDDEQKRLLSEWIEQGAEYEPHWAYIPPVRSASLPPSAAIDELVTRRLREKGLDGVNEASRRTLARRLSFDLTGLPADWETVQRFVEDSSPTAYERLVDKHMASERFGERMAVYWLDLVRYADSVGYHSDVEISMSPYRDYVIRAFNENKPFDEFTREQLAGDLLPNPTESQLVASAYNRLNRMTAEGGSQPKEYLAKYASDRIRTTSTIWLGSTLGCAECHDHKFDPFVHSDFYRFGSFFADIEERGVYGGQADFGSKISVMPDGAADEAWRLEAEIARLTSEGYGGLSRMEIDEETIAKYQMQTSKSWNAGWLAEALKDCAHPDISGCEDYDLAIDSNGAFVNTLLTDAKEKPREAMIRLRSHTYSAARKLTGWLLEVLPAKGFDAFDLSEFEVRVGGRKVALAGFATADGVPRNGLVDTVDGNYHSSWGGSFEEIDRYVAIFEPESPVSINQGELFEVVLTFNGRAAQMIPGQLRVSVTSAEFPDFTVGSGVDGYFERTGGNSNWAEIRKLERRAQRLRDSAVDCLVTKAIDDPRTMRVLPRGNWMDDSGEVVMPGVPHFLKQLETDGRRATRLDLANWLTDRENPLTARVFANRLWRMFFGTGLSKSLDDLGSQGDAPVNQQLLDWLAVEFMESGWDVKHLVRTMLLSQAYRRSSEPSEQLLASDPYNRLHGRQTISRVDAEFVRDSALHVSGLLNETVGGPSAKPYQPVGYYRELNFPKRVYEADSGDAQYRRGLYTHWQRTFLHPSMVAFDAPAREECTAEREISNTPLQSLVLLNDPTYVEAARVFASHLMAQADRDDARIEAAFKKAFSREPTAEERNVVDKLLALARNEFRAGPDRAAELLSVGASDIDAGVDNVELAAWTSVARALINKHEFVTRY